MMGVMTFVFTKGAPQLDPGTFPCSCSAGWSLTTSFVIAWIQRNYFDSSRNAALVKRIPDTAGRSYRVAFGAFLNFTVHLLIQIGLLLACVFLFGGSANIHWLWLPLLWLLEIMFVCGLALITSAVNVYLRDTRYIVESINTVLFWLVPIFYGFEGIPQRLHLVYEVNPIAALVFCLRDILLHGTGAAPRRPCGISPWWRAARSWWG